jgi:hypothetical protein
MQIHHINGCNWDSARVANLLPLCANCHLEDVEWEHGIPDWQALDLADRLCLMQRTQNPFVVDYRFTPLWKRMEVLRFLAPSGITLGRGITLDRVSEKQKWAPEALTEITKRAEKFKQKLELFKLERGSCQDSLSIYELRDILAHISTFQRGSYYSARVRSVLIHTNSNWPRLEPKDNEEPDAMCQDFQNHNGKRRRMVEDLVAEMLFFQGWDRPKSLNALIP